MVNKNDWKQISLEIRQAANWTCYCCNRNLNSIKKKSSFHAHEYWLFDSKKKVFKLACIVCVCAKCHQVIHFGHSSMHIDNRDLISWLMFVNHWERQDALNYIDGCFEQWSYNSSINWKFEISSLEEWLNENQIKDCLAFLEKKEIKVI